MQFSFIAALAIGCLIIIIAAVAFFMLFPGGDDSGYLRSNIKNIVSSQRSPVPSSQKEGAPRVKNALKLLLKDDEKKSGTSELTLKKRLKYAQWKLPSSLFMLFEALISIGCVTAAYFAKLNLVLQIFALGIGPLFMNGILNFAVKKRFDAFDKDFPQFIMSLVGLLKTGVNPTAGLQVAAEGLEYGSLVKSETMLMIERLRFGVAEDKSIGSFGEDVNHPEIELFVQALLLSRRVGGTLSDTLERLAKQMRKRQFFRRAAHSAVAMQRGSIWFIIAIMFCLDLYLYLVQPEMVTGAWKNDFGWQVWQFGILLIVVGIIWVRKVTNIRV